MARYVDGNGQLEEEHVFRIEVGQGHQQAGGAAAVGQLIQQSAEFCAWKNQGNSHIKILLSLHLNVWGLKKNVFSLKIEDQKRHVELTLIESACRMPVDGVQERAHDVTPASDRIMRLHEVKRDYGQNHPRETCKQTNKTIEVPAVI